MIVQVINLLSGADKQHPGLEGGKGIGTAYTVVGDGESMMP
jgi:hypothetical protein